MRCHRWRTTPKLDLIEPGAVAVGEWRPDPDAVEHPAPVDASIFGAVARKP